MTPGDHRARRGDVPAVVIAETGETITYAELDDRSMRLARRLHAHGLRPGGHVAALLDDHLRYAEVYWAAMRSGLYLTPVTWHLGAEEAGHVVADCGATALITSAALGDLVRAIGARRLWSATLRLVVDGDLEGFERYEDALAAHPARPLDDEREGSVMFYGSGTTGRPKGIAPPLSGAPYGSRPNVLAALLQAQWGFDADAVYLCSLPMYHGASIGFSSCVQRLGGTVVVPGTFDARRCLELVERHRVTHLQVAPVHLVALLALDEAEWAARDLSSLRVVLHAGARCPVEVKARAIDRLGPIVHEYYTGSEANGFTIVGPEEWLQHPGTVGRPVAGTVHVLDDAGAEVPCGPRGRIWFDTGARLVYRNAPECTAAAFNERGWSTIGDVGFVDGEGYLHLVDRAEHLFAVDGTTVYPQEVEDVLLSHPAVADVAVTCEGGRPLARVRVHVGIITGDPLAGALLERCRLRLPAPSVPCAIEFVGDVGRLPTGKLPKRALGR